MAKRRYEKIDLFGKSFELDTKQTKGYAPITYRDIDDCYGRCSETKRHIWRQWESWFNANNGYCSVFTYNCNFFTIEGYVRDFETRKMYYCYITASHNRCIEVV